MRKLFVVLVKAGGVFVALAAVASMIGVFISLVAFGSAPGGFLKILILTLVYLVIVLLLSYLLLLKTDKLADWLQVPDGDLELKPDYKAGLGLAIKILGLYFLVNGIVGFCREGVTVNATRQMMAGEFKNVQLVRVFMPLLVRIILGGLLAFRTGMVAKLVDEADTVQTKKLLGIGFAVLLAIFVLTGLAVRLAGHRAPGSPSVTTSRVISSSGPYVSTSGGSYLLESTKVSISNELVLGESVETGGGRARQHCDQQRD
jgi:hypothetical protein